MLVIERHDVSDFSVAVFAVGRAVDRITVHRGFSACRIEAHQTRKQRLFLALSVDIQRTLHGDNNTPVRHTGEAFKAAVRLTPFEDIWQTTRNRFFPFRRLRTVDCQDFPFTVDVNQERAILIAQPVTSFTIRSDPFRIQPAIIPLQSM